MIRGTVLRQWQEWSGQVLSDDAPDLQVREMKRAFYAGASAVYFLVTGFDADVSDEEGIKMLEDLLNELKEYTERVRSGAE